MNFDLVLHKQGRTNAHYRGRHSISGHIIDVYLPYDEYILLDNPPQNITIKVTVPND